MFNVLYRWRLKPGAEENFKTAWTSMTVVLHKERGALGSRLHQAADGTWVAYAQWPDRALWEKSGQLGSADQELSQAMQDAIEESLEPLLLQPVVDLLDSPHPGVNTAESGIADASISIREERAEDAEDVFRVNQIAFGRDAEAKLVDMLRKEAANSISLVAIVDQEIAGHILFSPVEVERTQKGLLAMGLAPMAVMPEYQQRGVGGHLVDAGVVACRDAGADAIFVLGHIDYYSRFGFESAAKFGLFYGTEEFGPYFMALELTPGALEGLSGLVQYHEEFDDV